MIGGGDRVALRDRVVLADGRTGALVSSDGTVDWWCPDRIDGPPLLWRLLDRAGAAVRVGPTGRSAGTQGYVGRTLVASTVFTAAGGQVEVVDLLAAPAGPAVPPTLLRVVTGRSGDVEVEVDVAAGRSWVPSRRVDRFHGGVVFDGWTVRADDLAFERTEAGARGVCRVRAGERVLVSVRRSSEAMLAEHDVLDLVDRTIERWTRTAGNTLSAGPFDDAVARSVLLLGGVPSRSVTTSVAVPGREDLAHDARHRWTADACSTVHLLDELGHPDVAGAALEWLHAVVQQRPPLLAAATVGGDPPADVEVHERLDGFRGGPVVVGLRPSEPERIDALGGLATVVPRLRASAAPLRAHAGWAVDEVPTGRRVAPHVRRWAFLDTMATAAVSDDPLDLDAAVWRQEARAADRHIEKALATTDDHDPRLLRVAWQGPLPAHHPLVATTIDRVLERRGDGPFVLGEELGSVAASWWAVRALAAVGRWEEAHDRAERLVSWAGAAGVLPRAVEPATGRFAGDLPDAAAHLALLAAVQTLAAGPR